jgi:hypothetical protein
MEVHAHTHTARKKWTHYFWEFLMLFLAVFCGFLAENFREHQVEHKREKEYMQSLQEDLKTDTGSLQTNIKNVDIAFRKIDSLLLFIKNNPRIKKINYDFIKLNTEAMLWLNFSLTDRTASQLKNAGNMRLIREKEISNQIMQYWSMGDDIKNSQQRFEIYRIKSREVFFKIFRVFDFYIYNHHLVTDEPIDIPVIKDDPALLAEYGNYIGSAGTVLYNHYDNLLRQYKLAVQLLQTISQSYHL